MVVVGEIGEGEGTTIGLKTPLSLPAMQVPDNENADSDYGNLHPWLSLL